MEKPELNSAVFQNWWCVVATLSCRPGYFQCPPSSPSIRRCIVERWLCDGDDDCGDNSDEDPQMCHANGQLTLTLQTGGGVIDLPDGIFTLLLRNRFVLRRQRDFKFGTLVDKPLLKAAWV